MLVWFSNQCGYNQWEVLFLLQSAVLYHYADPDPADLHACRVGISRGEAKLGSLGETSHSFAYESTGKINNFGPGDTIVCAVNLEDKRMASISFIKNGELLSKTIKFSVAEVVESQVKKKIPWESAFSPLILLKNVEVVMQFSIEDGLVIQDGLKSWASSLEDRNAISGPHVDDPKDCELMLLVGCLTEANQLGQRNG